MSITQRVKRSLVLGAAGAMVLSLLPAGIAAADTVVTDGSAACEGSAGLVDFNDALGSFDTEIECMAAYGITQGDADGNYDTTGTVTRQQMAQFIARLAVQAQNGNLDIPEAGEDAFDDIAGISADARNAINYLASTTPPIVAGTEGGSSYNPAGNVTREQMASFIARAHEVLGVDFSGNDPALTFTDADEISDVHAGNIDLLTGAGVVAGRTDGSYGPSAPITRGQMSAFIVRSIVVLDDQGLWNGEFTVEVPVDSNQTFTVTADETLVELDDTGTYPADDGDEVTLTVTGLEEGENYDLALVSTGATNEGPGLVDENGTVSFRDQDLDDVADNVNATYDGDMFISAYGTAFDFTDTAGAGTTHVDDATADSNGEIRVVVETVDAGDSANLLVWDDADGDDALDLDEDSTDSLNVPAEDFAISDVIVYHFGEAPSGYDDCCEDIVHIDKDAQFFVTEDGYFFNYDSTDSYEYAENEFSISFAEAQQALSIGDSMDLYNDVHDFYSRTGPSGFDFEEPDTPGTPINVTTAVGDFDEEDDGDDVQVSWDAPDPMNALISQYEVYRAETDDLSIWTSVGTTDFENDYTGVDTTLVDEDPAAGEYVYRVEAISRTSDEGDMSLMSNAATVEGPAGPTIVSAELTTDAVVIDEADTGDVWTLEFSEDMTVPAAGDTLTLTDADGDLILVECTGVATADNTTDATCAAGATPDTITVTLEEAATDRNASGDGDILYPLTITDTDGWVDVTDSTAVDLTASADVTVG